MKIEIKVTYRKKYWQITPAREISVYVYTNSRQYYERLWENYPAVNLRNFRRRYEKWIEK